MASATDEDLDGVIQALTDLSLTTAEHLTTSIPAVTTLISIPSELLIKILSLLSPADSACAGVVSKRLYDVHVSAHGLKVPLESSCWRNEEVEMFSKTLAFRLTNWARKAGLVHMYILDWKATSYHGTRTAKGLFVWDKNRKFYWVNGQKCLSWYEKMRN